MGEKSPVTVHLFLHTQTWSQAPSLGPEGPCQQELLERIFLKGERPWGSQELVGWEMSTGISVECTGTCVVTSKVRVLIVFWELEFYWRDTIEKIQSSHFPASLVSKMLFAGLSHFVYWEILKILKLKFSFLRRVFPQMIDERVIFEMLLMMKKENRKAGSFSLWMFNFWGNASRNQMLLPLKW